MKTAISLPDELFEEIEACARQLRFTRSGVIALAACQFVASKRRHPDPTRAWNNAIKAGGQPGDDPDATAMRRRAKAIVRGRRASASKAAITALIECPSKVRLRA